MFDPNNISKFKSGPNIINLDPIENRMNQILRSDLDLRVFKIIRSDLNESGHESI